MSFQALDPMMFLRSLDCTFNFDTYLPFTISTIFVLSLMFPTAEWHSKNLSWWSLNGLNSSLPDCIKGGTSLHTSIGWGWKRVTSYHPGEFCLWTWSKAGAVEDGQNVFIDLDVYHSASWRRVFTRCDSLTRWVGLTLEKLDKEAHFQYQNGRNGCAFLHYTATCKKFIFSINDEQLTFLTRVMWNLTYLALWIELKLLEELSGLDALPRSVRTDLLSLLSPNSLTNCMSSLQPHLPVSW